MTVRAGSLRYFASIKNGSTPVSGESSYWEGDVAWATPDDLGQLNGSYIHDTRRTVTQLAVAETNLNVVPIGTILMSTRAPIGHMAIAATPMAFNQGCRGLIPRDGTWGPYLLYVLKSRVPELHATANGTTFVELSRDDLASVEISLPSLEIQQRIATYLDGKTAQIDALIAKKQALLERLAEKRRAVITQAVTKGLDPRVRMKDSGTNWLGRMPAHWERGNIRRFAVMKTGHTPSRNNPDYWLDCTIPWFTLSDVWQLRDGTRIYIEDSAEKISEVGLGNSAAELLPAGTVIFSRTASIGFSGIMPCPMATTQDFWNWICGPKLDPEYLLLLFRAMIQKFEEITSGSTHQTIYQPIAASLQICVPPRNEQEVIKKYVFSQIGALDQIRVKIEASISRLRELRSALITAAVTGQIEGMQ